MRLYVNLVSGEVSVEWPARAGQARQEVKAMTGERVQIRWHLDGVPVLLEEASSISMQVRAAKGGTLLAEVTELEAPDTAESGYYEGRLSLNTTAVQALLAAQPSKPSFLVVAAVQWTIPGAGAPEESDDIVLDLQRKVGASGEDPLVLLTPWSWLKDRLVAGANITLTVDNEGETITIAGEEGGGGAADWGDIGGTLADQTDLQAALDGKASTSHTHAIADTTGLQAALDGKASTSHTHAIADTTGLQAALDGKAATSHTHAIADTTGLQAALDAKASTSHTHAISDTTGLQTALDGKAATSHTHAISDTTGLQTALDGKAATSHTHAISDTTGLQTALDGKANIYDTTATAQEITLTIVGGANDLHEEWIDIFTTTERVRVWFDTGSGTPPALPDGRRLQVLLTPGGNSVDAAIEIASYIDADAAFTASAASADVVITNVTAGLTDPPDTGISASVLTYTQTPGADSVSALSPIDGRDLTNLPGEQLQAGSVAAAALAAGVFDDVAPTTTKGDLIVHNGVANVRLPVGGTNGHSLQLDDAEPLGVKWAAPSGGSSPGLPVQAVKTDTASIASATFAAISGLSASLTPASVTQPVLVRAVLQCGHDNVTGGVYRLTRNGTVLTQADAAGSRIRAHAYSFGPANQMFSVSIEFLDVPGTGSSVTYAVEWARNGASGTLYLNRTGTDTDSSIWPRAASTLTAIPFPE